MEEFMEAGKPAFPKRRAAAQRNRDKILDAAREAFAAPAPEVSMAEIARRAQVGMATLYRNFPGRRELLEALYADEVDQICDAAAIAPGQSPDAALIAWLRLLIAFLPHKRLIVSELLEHTDGHGVAGHRARAVEAGRPLLAAAQRTGRIRGDLTLEQIFDLIVAIAKLNESPDYLRPLFETALAGLRAPRS
ncbi:Transcriptional regulator, TetR family [Streptomyces misionensis JCM 4497]